MHIHVVSRSLLYLGTRLVNTGAPLRRFLFVVDGGSPVTVNLNLGEDVLIRVPLGQLGAGTHTITATHARRGRETTSISISLSLPFQRQRLPTETTEAQLTAATDWDTLHSHALAPERTAWMIDSLGFRARVNHYAGALWFYELNCAGQQYASATRYFLRIARPESHHANHSWQGPISRFRSTIRFEHLNLIGDTTRDAGDGVCAAAEQWVHGGLGASQWKPVNDLFALDGHGRQCNHDCRAELGTTTPNLTITSSGTGTATIGDTTFVTFSGGVAGNWYTDLEATPRLNRAVRDWSLSFFQALDGYGLDATASFSMELGNGDPSTDAGIAQRYPDQTAALLSTPSLQTNFSPTSAAFWQQVHLDMATVMNAAGLRLICSSGKYSGGTFRTLLRLRALCRACRSMTLTAPAAFQTQYGRAMTVITSNTVDPTTFRRRPLFARVDRRFTAQIRAFVRASLSELPI